MMLRTEKLNCCPICGSGGIRRIRTAADHESHSGEYGIDECAGCGIAFTNPRPLEEELPKLYAQRNSKDFPRVSGFVQSLRDYTIDRYLADQLGGSAISDNGNFVVLDYGCGDGALVRGLLRFGRKRNIPLCVTAVDFHDEAPPAIAEAGSAVTYQVNAAWHRDPGHYDAVFLRHVLEHHPQPLRLLSDLADTLKPGGRLYIEVPNRQSIWARIFGPYFFAWYLPRHLFHFDPPSLADTVRRAGFHTVTVRPTHHPLIGGSLGYMTGLGIGNTSLIGLAAYPLQVALDMVTRRSTTLLATASAHD